MSADLAHLTDEFILDAKGRHPQVRAVRGRCLLLEDGRWLTIPWDTVPVLRPADITSRTRYYDLGLYA